jgi:hypothetical protein
MSIGQLVTSHLGHSACGVFVGRTRRSTAEARYTGNGLWEIRSALLFCLKDGFVRLLLGSFWVQCFDSLSSAAIYLLRDGRRRH